MSNDVSERDPINKGIQFKHTLSEAISFLIQGDYAVTRNPYDFYVGNEINNALELVKKPDFDLWRRNRKMYHGYYNAISKNK